MGEIQSLIIVSTLSALAGIVLGWWLFGGRTTHGRRSVPVLAWGLWNSAHGRWFVRERLRIDGHIWTPIVLLSWRYGWFIGHGKDEPAEPE